MSFKYQLLDENRQPRGEFVTAVCDWRVGDSLMLRPDEVYRIVAIERTGDEDTFTGVLVLAITESAERRYQPYG